MKFSVDLSPEAEPNQDSRVTVSIGKLKVSNFPLQAQMNVTLNKLKKNALGAFPSNITLL